MNTRRAVSLLVLSLFLFSMLGVSAGHIGDITGRATDDEDEGFWAWVTPGDREDKPGAPAKSDFMQIDLSGAAEAIASFGGLCGEDKLCSSEEAELWYYVPITMLVIILLVYLLLRQSVFKKIGGGEYTSEVVAAIIAICFGSLAVYKTAVAFWVANVGITAVLLALVFLGIYMAYSAYTHGRGAFGALRTEHLRGLSGRRRANALNLKQIAEVKRAQYLTEADEGAIKEMEETESELITEDKSIIRVAEGLRQQFARAVEVWERQPTITGSSSTARAEIRRILPSTKWLKQVVDTILRQREQRASALLSRINEVTNAERRLLKKLGKDAVKAERLENVEMRINYNEEKQEKDRKALNNFREKYAIEKPIRAKNLVEKKIMNQAINISNKARGLLGEVQKFQRAEEANIRTLDPLINEIVSSINSINHYTGRYMIPRAAGLKHFQNGLRVATLFEEKARALYIKETKEEGVIKELERLEKEAKQIGVVAFNTLRSLKGLEYKELGEEGQEAKTVG